MSSQSLSKEAFSSPKMNLCIVRDVRLFFKLAEHPEEGRNDRLLTGAHQVREILTEMERGFFQVIMWNLKARKVRFSF